MPTERQHGGSALLHIPLVTPGFRGLNTQQASGILGPEWATYLRNAVIDDNGRLSSRKGWTPLASSAVADNFVQITEYFKSDGTSTLVACSTTKLYESTNNGASWADITGAVSFTTGNWQFVNFNNQIWAAQAGFRPIVYDGTATFRVTTDTNAPTGGVILAGFGRLWVTHVNGHSLGYSGLLDGDDWTTTSSGKVDMWTSWPGNDQIQALAVFGGALVVFGRKSVVMWSDGAGSKLAIDPLTMYVVDIISGTGCLAKHSVQLVDGDLWFLSDVGIQSLGRLVQERNNPIVNVSQHVQDYLRYALTYVDTTQIRAVYSPQDRLYLLSLPVGGSTAAGQSIVFDTRGKDQDGANRCVGVWDGFVPTAVCATKDGLMIAALSTVTGIVGKYYGTSDNGNAYTFQYESGWADLAQSYTVIPKRMVGVVYSSGTIALTFKWAFDFQLSWDQSVKTFTGVVAGSEWASGEWGTGEFGGDYALRSGTVAAKGSGKYVKVGLSTVINSSSVAIQQLDLYSKIGRLA